MLVFTNDMQHADFRMPGITEWLFLADRAPMMPWRLQAVAAGTRYARDKNRNVLHVDHDVLFNDSLGWVSDALGQNQIMLTRRDHASMPFNTGVMACRGTDANVRFWIMVRDICRTMPVKHQEWYGDQLAVAAAFKVAENAYEIATGKCDDYNWSPEYGSTIDAPPRAKVIHLKGKRKPIMKELLEALRCYNQSASLSGTTRGSWPPITVPRLA